MPEGIYRLPSLPGEAKSVWLTFDDGPVPEATPFVLEELARYDAKATFFMVGENARRYPELVEMVLSGGHTIGNHTYHHLNGRKVSAEEYLADVAKAAEVIESRWMRPPHGWIGRRAMRTLREQAYRPVMYDVVTRDYSQRQSSQGVVDVVKRLTRDGSIIVMHDSVRSMPRLREALPQCLEWLREEGYQFKAF